MDQFEFFEVSRVNLNQNKIALGIANLRKRRERGIALSPKKDKKGYIVVSTHLPIGGPMLLEAIIHEAMHIVLPKISEKKIQSSAYFISKVIQQFNKKCTKPLLKHNKITKK